MSKEPRKFQDLLLEAQRFHASREPQLEPLTRLCGLWLLDVEFQALGIGARTVARGTLEAVMLESKRHVRARVRTVEQSSGFEYFAEVILSYDPYVGGYVSVMYDNGSAGFDTYRGGWDDTTSTLRLAGQVSNPAIGRRHPAVQLWNLPASGPANYSFLVPKGLLEDGEGEMTEALVATMHRGSGPAMGPRSS